TDKDDACYLVFSSPASQRQAGGAAVQALG
ncbi:hypothetical protein, partial [Pseudomonas aeruginosa]